MNFHGECTPHRTSSMINSAYPHNAYHQFVREDDMEGMLRDAFDIRSHGLQSFPSKIIASDDCNIGGNAFTETGRSVPDEEPNGDVAKFYKNTEYVNEDEGEAQSRKKPIIFSTNTKASKAFHVIKDNRVYEKSFDSKFPSFARDPQNVRLGLASDGFNPFKIMSTSYNTWLVMLVPYKLPPWICMKQSSFILSMIISGEKGPRNDIDIYMQPLIEELKLLWAGVETYDVLKKEKFYLRAALLWTINDFPAYANLYS
ncbi:hypothetical protein CXB51_021843 [Gossypium anomalum]|uniref:Uncharacterized protein n=1 Tax=Gossypium anomalum TaxID=47600 RepID=A0A8J5YK37_9ROSI|nr:hypothetical protein CXB51_021843 [Gossypium anomalum]